MLSRLVRYGKHILVSNRAADAISLVVWQTLTVVESIAVPSGPDCIDVTRDGKEAWVTARWARGWSTSPRAGSSGASRLVARPMACFSPSTRRATSLLAAATLLAGAAHGAPACKGTLYLALSTSSMSQAEDIVRILAKHDVKATFFLANEKTVRGDDSLDPSWGDYWRERVAEGHAFGSHTWDHGYFRGDVEGGRVRYVRDGKTRLLDADAVCTELKRVDTRFRELTGRGLDPIWRAPGGRTAPNTLAAAKRCGYEHVRWASAGVLGDELPSDKYPNDVLLDRALKNLRDGDVMVMHLGILSRKEPFAPMLDSLLAGLKARGFCFATLAKGRRQ